MPHWLWKAVVVPILFSSPLLRAGDARGVRITVYGVSKIEACADQVEPLRAELATLPLPDNWTVAVVCTPTAWEQLLRIADVTPTHTAFTNLPKRTTLVNGAIFRGQRSRYRHTLAHEIAHITCKCGSDSQAEELASKIERMPNPTALAKADPAGDRHGSAPGEVRVGRTHTGGDDL